jgi:hypothetical protein
MLGMPVHGLYVYFNVSREWLGGLGFHRWSCISFVGYPRMKAHSKSSCSLGHGVGFGLPNILDCLVLEQLMMHATRLT